MLVVSNHFITNDNLIEGVIVGIMVVMLVVSSHFITSYNLPEGLTLLQAVFSTSCH